MAVTKVCRIKEAVRKNKAAELKKNIFYICDDKKTDGGIFIGGNAGLTPEVIFRTMIWNKKFWDKPGGTQGFSFVLSFPPDCGVEEETVYQIAEEFCQELLKDSYYYVFAVHNDKAHMHVHITFDAVSKKDGMKFHSPKGDWIKRIIPLTDRLCEKYHLPVLENGEKRCHRSYAQWRHDRRPEDEFYTWHDIIRDDIDEAILKTQSYEGFLDFLKENGYVVTRDAACLSLKPFGREQAVQTGRLGEGYDKEEIIKRISEREMPDTLNRYKTYGNREKMREIIYAKIEHSPGWKMTPFQKKFWKRWNNTYFVRKPQLLTSKERAKRRQDITEIQKLSDAIRYLLDYDIENLSDLKKRGWDLDEELKTLSRKYSACEGKYYKKQPFSLLFRMEKLQKSDPCCASTQTQEEIKKIKEQIEKICPIKKAEEGCRELKEEMITFRAMIKDGKKEKKQIDEIMRLASQMEPEKILDQVPFIERPIEKEIKRDKEAIKDGAAKEETRRYFKP